LVTLLFDAGAHAFSVFSIVCIWLAIMYAGVWDMSFAVKDACVQLQAELSLTGCRLLGKQLHAAYEGGCAC